MRILLLGASPKELKSTLERFQSMTKVTKVFVDGYKCFSLNYGGNDILISYTGVGTDNAALATNDLCNSFKPDLVVMAGTSGALLGSPGNEGMEIGDVVISKRVVYVDQYALFQILPNIEAYKECAYNPHTGEQITHDYASPSMLLDIAEQLSIPRVVSGTIGVSNFFPVPTDMLSKTIYPLECKSMEMEGSGVFKGAARHNVPVLIARAISNKLDSDGIDLGTTPEGVALCSAKIAEFILAFITSPNLTKTVEWVRYGQSKQLIRQESACSSLLCDYPTEKSINREMKSKSLKARTVLNEYERARKAEQKQVYTVKPPSKSKRSRRLQESLY